MKPKLHKLKLSAPLAIAALAIVGALTLLAPPDPNRASAQAGDASASGTPAATAPGPVRNLTATQLEWFSPEENLARGATTNSSYGYTGNWPAAEIYINWDLPADNGGSPVTSYYFKSWRGGKAATIGALSRALDVPNWKHSLHPNYPTEFSGVIYGINKDWSDHNYWWRFEVAARNSAGIGPFSKVDIRIDKDADASIAEALAPLGDKLAAVLYFDNISKEYMFYDHRPEFAGLNTLEELVAGESYWLIVTDDFEDIPLGGKLRSLTCNAAGNCWNLIVW